MNNKERKKIQKNYAKKNISFFFSLLKNRFEPSLDSFYIQEIQRFATSFNIRLSREEKLQFCKNCNCYWDNKSRQIRLNSNLKTKDYICKNCGFTRRFKYKN